MDDERWLLVLQRAVELFDINGPPSGRSLQQAANEAGLTRDERRRFVAWVNRLTLVD